MTRVAERLSLSATSVPRARQLLEAFRPVLTEEAFGQLRLVASELVANCVRHSRGHGTVSIEAISRDRHVHVAVKCPKGESAPHIPVPGARADGGGLGLFIVDAVAADWGIGEEGADSLVWADIAVGEPSAHPAA